MVTNPIPNFSLIWAGWETTVHKLALAGWEIYVEDDYYNYSKLIALKHNRLQIVGVSDHLDQHSFNFHYNYYGRLPALNMQYLSFKIMINIDAVRSFTRADEMLVDHTRSSVPPYPHHSQTISLADLLDPSPKEQKIIVPSYSISELLAMIKEQQAPRQKEIRKKLETNKYIEKPMAKIISLEEARHG